MLRSCNEIYKLLKKDCEKEEKRKVVVEDKGKEVIMDKGKRWLWIQGRGLPIEGGMRIVVCGLAAGQQVKRLFGK